MYRPDADAVDRYVSELGLDAIYRSVELRRRCCEIRKVEPLARALAGKAAWVTGLRRAQSVTRADLPLQEFEPAHGLWKFNPLAEWSEREVWDYLRSRGVPYNPLHDRGFRSIGCAPCTRPTAAGEDLRAGRWWWEDAQSKECGLHKPSVEATDAQPGHTQMNNLASEARLVDDTSDDVQTSQPPRLAGVRGRAHPAGGGGRVPQPGAAVLRRQGLRGGAAAGGEGVPSGPIPFPVLHIDTGHNFPEAIEFRDTRVAELGVRLLVGSVEDSIRRGTVKLRRPDESRNVAQSITLLEAIAAHKLDACIGGARRDEEKARAKERVFSFRDEFGQWDPKNQRPELWNLYNPRVHPGEHVRVFPISNWTELDVWQYIERERMSLPTLVFRPSARGHASQRPAGGGHGRSPHPSRVRSSKRSRCASAPWAT